MGPLAPVLNSILEGTGGVKEKRTSLQTHWSQIVGNQLGGHTRPSLTPEGWLSVWVDDSTLACEVRQRYLGTILKRTEAILGEGAIKKMAVKVGRIR